MFHTFPRRARLRASFSPRLRNKSSKSSFSTSRGCLARATEYLQNHDPDFTDTQRTVRDSIAKICSKFGDEYWLRADKEHRFPVEFQQAIAQAGWLGICMPAAYGGSDLGISEASVMMQTISESGAGYAGASAVHVSLPASSFARFVLESPLLDERCWYKLPLSQIQSSIRC